MLLEGAGAPRGRRNYVVSLQLACHLLVEFPVLSLIELLVPGIIDLVVGSPAARGQRQK